MTPNQDTPTSQSRPFTCRRIGEVVLRVSAMDAMIEFYTKELGLKLLRRFEDEVAFLQVGEGNGEDVNTVTFFTEGKVSNFNDSSFDGLDPERTTLHHFALNIPAGQYEKAMLHFKERGIPFSTAVHTWVGWRSIFLHDPGGNTVELVCYDAAYDRGDAYDYSKLYGDPFGEH